MNPRRRYSYKLHRFFGKKKNEETAQEQEFFHSLINFLTNVNDEPVWRKIESASLITVKQTDGAPCAKTSPNVFWTYWC